MPYAMAKALWQYEPGYAKRLTGQAYNPNIVNIAEETEAIMTEDSTAIPTSLLHHIVEEKFLIEFILYEVVSPKHPNVLLEQSEDELFRLVEYLDKFH